MNKGTYALATIAILGCFIAAPAWAQAPPNDAVVDALHVDGLPFTDASVNVDQAALILQGTDCTIPDSNPSSPFSAVVYKFTPTSSGDITVTIASPSGTSTIIFYTADDENATQGSELTIQSACGTRTSENRSVTTGQAYYVAVVNTGGATDIEFTGTTVLPVELTSFDVVADGRSALLSWETASETNNAGFEIQYKAGDVFAVLGFVEGAGTTEAPQRYGYRVDGVEPGRHVFRLQQIDFDGTFEYSPEVEVFVELPEHYHLSAPYPNPFNPSTHFTVMVAREQSVRIEVLDVQGRRVALLHTGRLSAHAVHDFTFEAHHLPTGMYAIRTQGETFEATRTLVLVK